ncbi:MAG: hypothetical protein IPH51_11175 [Rubrivivax sp.]|nr:hypothetical protein [Rubrivivax sp.]MBK8527221.1 hypothetical protein [Rubrivivax sp.]
MTADLHEVEPARRSGVALDAIASSRKQWQREQRRPSALTAREALAALSFEALLVWTAAANIRNNVELTAEDFERLTIACSRITVITEEVAHVAG